MRQVKENEFIFSFLVAELLEREPQVLGEVVPERLHQQPPRQRDAGHQAHLHRHQNAAPPVRDARQEVVGRRRRRHRRWRHRERRFSDVGNNF